MKPTSERRPNKVNYIVSRLSGLIGDKRAVTALEYAMIASLIAVACVAIIGTLGGNINNIFSSINSHLSTPGSS
jgi:pilus assembly protein Flp/PilA